MADTVVEAKSPSTPPPVSNAAQAVDGAQASPLSVHVALWTASLLAVAGSSWFSVRGLHLAGVHPVPLRINPLLIGIGALLGIVGVTLAWAGYRSQGGVRWWHSGLTVFVAILSLGAIISSLYPGLGTVAARDFLPPPQGLHGSASFALPVFFENGAWTLTPSERRHLASAFAVFRHCEAGTLFLRGFASSAPFRGRTAEQSRELNRQLANRRATEVNAVLQSAASLAGTIQDWESPDSMIEQRRIVDIGLIGERLTAAEELNRRVEVFWNDSACVGIKPGPAK